MRDEQYQDYIPRLFPSDDPENHHIINATLQVTDACNLRCTYCYQINKGTHVMPLEVGKKFIDMILDESMGVKEYHENKIADGIILEFIGGEPFLEIDLIDKLTDYFIDEMIRKRHPCATRFRISICSNGLLYFDPKVQAYIKKHFNHLSFSISIDGNKELHDSCRVLPDGSGSYDTAIAGVKHFTQVLHGIMGSKMTLAPQNIMHTCEAVKSLIADGYTVIHLNCVYEEGWTVEHARILYEQLKELADYVIDNNLDDKLYIAMFEQGFFRPKANDDIQNWCGGNGQMISVDYKGDIYPCIRYMESSLGLDIKPLKIGNIYDGVLKTQECIDCNNCLKSITRKSQSTEECFNCPIAEGCAWCTAYNYQVFGTPDARATYICIMHQARALANAYFWNKKFHKENSNKRMKLWIPEDWALKIISQEEWDMLKSLEK